MAKGKGLDSPKSLIGLIPELKADGITFVGRYIFTAHSFKNILTKTEVSALHAAGIKIITIWESGSPTVTSYFTQDRAVKDANDAVRLAKSLGQPADSPIYFCADLDARASDVRDYFATVQRIVKGLGFKFIGAYADGEVCQDLVSRGIASYTWLSQSRGWRGYNSWVGKANITQLPEGTFHEIGVDWDETNGNGGGW